jgi:uncharacterized membrane protein YfcA
MLDWNLALAFAIGVAAATLTAPVGISGAVLLLPAQVSVLAVAPLAVTPTSLLYNVIATPGAIVRYARQRQLDRRLAATLAIGTLPGVVVGAWLRVEHLSGIEALRVLMAIVLLASASTVLIPRATPPRTVEPGAAALIATALPIGLLGGLVGIGGGSLLAPLLVALGGAITRIAPAALVVTWLTSLVGLGAFAGLATLGRSDAAADWPVGIALGVGGMCGGWLGARLQPSLPAPALRLLLAGLAAALGLIYAVMALR